jgi:hypothetical protein
MSEKRRWFLDADTIDAADVAEAIGKECLLVDMAPRAGVGLIVRFDEKRARAIIEDWATQLLHFQMECSLNEAKAERSKPAIIAWMELNLEAFRNLNGVEAGERH